MRTTIWLTLALLALAPSAAAQAEEDEADPFADDEDPFAEVDGLLDEYEQSATAAITNATSEGDGSDGSGEDEKSDEPAPETSPTSTQPADTGGKDTPGLGALAVLGAVGAAAAVFRRARG